MKRSREPEQDINPASPGSPDEEASLSGSQHMAKYTELDLATSDSDIDDDDTQPPASSVHILCSLPPHAEMAFTSYAAYEVHYSSAHTNRCLTCRKNFPSQHLLDVHIEEMHDPLAKVKREQGGYTFSCFVEGCDRKCATPQKRRMHMIDKHLYPRNFFFAVTRDGIDGRRSLLVDGGGGGREHRRRRSSGASQTKGVRRRAATMEKEAGGSGEQQASSSSAGARTHEGSTASPARATDADVDAITGSMASLRFVPGAVRFGNRNRRGFAKE
ncbi:hypothetical protein PWT90_02981 [Aphanocladium album]|nr:hypothetical protein PWT90_02981 [Aphanocladium album]